MIFKLYRRKSDGCGEEILWFAAGGEKQQLAFVDDVCIVDDRIRVCDAGPVGGVTELGLRDLRQRVALANVIFCVVRGGETSRRKEILATGQMGFASNRTG